LFEAELRLKFNETKFDDWWVMSTGTVIVNKYGKTTTSGVDMSYLFIKIAKNQKIRVQQDPVPTPPEVRKTAYWMRRTPFKTPESF